MRKGYNPELVFDKKGNIFAIATGSDACAEHEVGSAAMQRVLCTGFAGKDSNVEATLIKQLREADKEPGLMARLLNLDKKPVAFPDLLAQKIINNNLGDIHFVEGVDERLKQPVGLLWFSERHHTPDVNYRELAIFDKEATCAGAWDERSFAFKVVGDKLIAKLRAFAEKLKAGQGCFAGLFLAGGTPRLGGVIIALHTELRPEHRAAIAKAQKEYEDNMLLKARSRLDELNALAYPRQGKREAHWQSPGYLWPVWKDQVVGGEVMYALNPSYGVDAAYLGPYSFEQIAQWIRAEKKFKLVPAHRTEEAANAAA
jgi:hypothetical protein